MIGRLSLVLGLALVLLGAVVLAGEVRPGSSLNQVSPTAALPAAFATSRPATTSFPTAIPGPEAIPPGYRVQIPRLKIDLGIEEGDVVRDIDNQQTPEDLAFHLTGTAIPEGGSNTYIYAHAREGMFLSLWEARVGDEVFISTPGGKLLTYIVSEVRPRVAPTDVSVASPTPSERLTLQTSTGPNPDDPRFVVIALPKT